MVMVIEEKHPTLQNVDQEEKNILRIMINLIFNIMYLFRIAEQIQLIYKKGL